MKNALMSLVEDKARQRVQEACTAAKVNRQIPEFTIGDTVDVYLRFLEGEKERIQVYNGLVISMRGHGATAMFTVRRIVQGEGVERIFPLESPRISKLEVKRHGEVRRAKLYYLRDRVGKATRLRERKKVVR
jgi:large subunit ribosomal protein L19